MTRWLPWRRRDGLSDRRVEDLELLALDIETTGLDPARHEVLSFGMVPVRGLSIELAEARHYAVRPVRGAGVGDSATVHGITDDVAAGAEPMEEVLPRVLAALEGRVLLAHHASIEVGFLTAACRAHGRQVPTWTVVDTVRLQRRVLRRGRAHGHLAEGELRLGPARRRLGLPPYRSHEAMTDALACAELFLAQVAALGGDGGLSLRQLQR